MKALLTLLTITVHFSVLIAQKQLNYRKISDTIVPPACGWLDSLTLSEVVPKIEALDTNLLTAKSRYYYYDDFSMMHYQYFGYILDSTLLERAARASIKALYHRPDSRFMIRNVISLYSRLGKCEEMKPYILIYCERVPQKYWLSDGIAFLSRGCIEHEKILSTVKFINYIFLTNF